MIVRKDPDPAALAPDTLALSALGWVLADDARAQRFLSLTGFTPETLRTSLAQRAVQSAVLEFLSAHEPDLIAAAHALEVPPQALIAAGERLNAPAR